MAQRRLRFAAQCLAIVVAVACAYMAVLEYFGGEPSKPAILLYNITFALALVYVVEADRRGRAVTMPYEYGAYLFFLWPVALPAYLFQTRRWPGLAIAVGVLVLSEAPSLAAWVVYSCLASSGT